jgi:hypothetical protein
LPVVDFGGDLPLVDASPDAAPDLTSGWTPTDAGVSCGFSTCAPNQVCIHPCANTADLSCPSGNCSIEYCVDVPASCSSFVTCGCFAPDPCWSSGGTCSLSNFPLIWCGQCPI